MKIIATSPKNYIDQLPIDRQVVMKKLRNVIKTNIPTGFSETMLYDMISYVVPHTRYPAGYHCKPTDPLPFISIASQKNFIALYHMGIYADSKLLSWFVDEYLKHAHKKLDMGKSCIRFKYLDDIPYELIGQLVQKMSVQEWVRLYEQTLKK